MSEASEKDNIVELEPVVEQETIEKPYTLRKLNNGDTKLVIKILGILIPDDLKKAFNQVISEYADNEDIDFNAILKKVGIMVGIDIVSLVIKDAWKAMDDIEIFLAGLAGISVKELNEMEFGTTPMMLMDVVNDVKNASFFKAVFKSF